MSNKLVDEVRKESQEVLRRWIESCTRGGKVSRNTVAMGVVVINHLKHKCPASRDEVISQGGEVKGARSGLGTILAVNEIPATYLKEVTTRQGHQDGQKLFEGLRWGARLAELEGKDRDSILNELLAPLLTEANSWLKRQSLKLQVDRRQTPATWIHIIIENAKDRSGGVVEQHLVGAKLERRFKGMTVPNYPAHAGDKQTARDGDFKIAKTVYHVTASPSRNVLQKCAGNIRGGLSPVLLVPDEQQTKARILAQDEGIGQELTILSIEDFLSMNIIEVAMEESKDFFAVLKDIVQIYNRRLDEVETDLSLQIQLS